MLELCIIAVLDEEEKIHRGEANALKDTTNSYVFPEFDNVCTFT